MKGRTAVVVAVLTAAAGLAAATARSDNPLERAITHQEWSSYGALLQSSDASTAESQYKNPPNPICTTTTSSDANVSTDCEATAPHNETTIAVNPTNADNMIGGANDYQLANGGKNETIFSRAHVTTDGGRTWTMVGVPTNGYVATGDPGVAFDASGRAYYSMLGFGFGQGSPTGKNPDIIVATSTDGGSTWTTPATVAKGTGSFGSVGTFNDKPMIAAWGNGNAIVTWTVFNDLQGGAYGGSPIFASVTHDGGATWSPGVEISGSAPFCVGYTAATSCDQSQGATPVVAADGSIYVSFLTTRSASDFRDAYAVVQINPQTGKRIAGPYDAADLYDGINDYPIDAEGRQTYQDSQFRTWSLGNIAADPTNAKHLAVTWSDMLNSSITSFDPYATTTNSDVGVAESFDGGRTWTTTRLKVRNDQFMPWAAFDSAGRVRVGYFDRSYDSANHKYGYTLATETKPDSLRFTTQQVTTVLSDPTQGDRWFSGTTVNSAFPHPTAFLGDYSGITTGQSGVALLWTDMRATVTFGTRSGSGEDAEYATAQ